MTEKEAEKKTTLITTADQNICIYIYIYMYIIDLEKKDEKKTRARFPFLWIPLVGWSSLKNAVNQWRIFLREAQGG